jgi:hypothetical protein
MKTRWQLSSFPFLLVAIAAIVGVPGTSAFVPFQFHHETNRRTKSKSCSSAFLLGIDLLGRRRNGSIMPCATSDVTSSNTDNNRKEEEELTPERVAELIEVSFVNGVMQLAQGYVDVVKLFIASVLSAYKMGMTSTELLKTVASCPDQSANRPLMEDEEELRSTWIQVVYLVLNHVGYNGARPLLEENTSYQVVQEKYAAAIPILKEMKQQDQKLEATTIFDKLSMDPPKNPLEEAIFLQTLRVASLTFMVLDEEAQCVADKAPLKSQPPIPGAFD